MHYLQREWGGLHGGQYMASEGLCISTVDRKVYAAILLSSMSFKIEILLARSCASNPVTHPHSRVGAAKSRDAEGSCHSEPSAQNQPSMIFWPQLPPIDEASLWTTRF
ncbi:hypothetical protein IF2G_00096 [Cordyceps javanica]|nr:hypothetical protein IF2G_00096 [Cordyceps javanica]